MMQPFFYAHPDEVPPAAQLLSAFCAGGVVHHLPTYLSCEHFAGDPRWPGVRVRACEHVHEVYHVLLYLGGEGHFSWRGRWHPATRGTLVITEPGQSHLFGSQSRTDSVYAHISFRLVGATAAPGFAEYLQALTGLNGLRCELPLTLTARAARQAEGMYAAVFAALAEARPIRWHAVQRRILDLFLFFAEELFAPRSAAANAEPLEAARRELDWRYAEALSVTELARIACLSTGQFLRAFRKAFGDSPIHYQKCRRVQAAQNLLLTTHLTCKEIAARLGFSDEYHFNKAFRSLTGRPPGAFRQQEQM